MRLIYHITTQKRWQAAFDVGVYMAESQESEGFIHCSTARQVVPVANERFLSQQGLVLLAIDEAHTVPEVRYEDCYETGQKFPHIYGPMNLDAVIAVIPFTPGGDGLFVLPAAVLALDTPLLEHDPDPVALLNAQDHLPRLDIASRCVVCFFQDVLTGLKQAGELEQVYILRSEIGPNPVYEMTMDGRRLTVFHPGVGAPLAAGFLDELIALGCDTFIACGGAGVLDSSIPVGHVVVPSSAIRDEGVSYHYLPPSREVSASERGVAAIERILQRDGVPYVVGKTWTTDGVYRETREKIKRRRAEGCFTVEMEAAAFYAVAAFRGVTFAQILYGGDDVGSDTWDSRHWVRRTSVREKLFWLAAEACLEL